MRKLLLLLILLLAGLIVPTVNADSTGPNSPSNAIDSTTPPGSSWSIPTNVFLSDDSRALASVAAGTITHYLNVTNFSFSIPTGVTTIDGIQVDVENYYYSVGGGSNSTLQLKLVKNGVISGNENNISIKSNCCDATAERYNSTGNSSYLWGQAWTPSDINNANFGVSVIATSDKDETVYIDHIRITVYYSECSNLSAAGTYTLTKNISSTGTCLTIGSNNITIDGAGYWINYSQTSAGYGINNSGGYDNITIKNLNIVQDNATASGSTNYGIYGSGMSNSTIFNVTISTKDTSAYGIRLVSSSQSNNLTGNVIATTGSSGYGIYVDNGGNSNTLADNNITTSNSNGFGLYMYGASSNSISNNRITTTGSNSGLGIYLDSGSNNNFTSNIVNTTGESSYGIWVQATEKSPTNNVFSSNTITTTGLNGHGVYLDSAVSTNITGGSIIVSGGYSYYLKNTSTSNNFTNTNFTAQRKIWFNDVTSWFNYNNGSDSTWLKNNVSSASKAVLRKLINWNNSSMIWNDSAESGTFTTNYNVTGLYANAGYVLDKTTSGVKTTSYLKTDSTGVLNFTTSLSTATTTINMSLDNTPPTYSSLAINSSSIKKNDSIKFSALWSDDSALGYYIFSWNQSGSWVNDTPALFGSDGYSNITKQVTANKSQRVDYIIFVNDSLGNLNQTTQDNFTIQNSAPTTVVSIIPSPAQVSDNLNCTETYFDIDNDIQNQTWYRWYVNDALSAFTSQNLSVGNYSANDNVICSVMVNDGTENATSWKNSSQLTIGDLLAPVLKNASLSATSGYTQTAFNIFVNVTEANTLQYVYVEITDPNTAKTNYTMTQQAHVGTEWRFNYTFTPITAGNYLFSFHSKDGSNNAQNLTSTLLFTASVYVPPTSSGGGGETTVTIPCNLNRYCDKGESLSNCPSDCTFPFSFKPQGGNYTLWGASISTSYQILNKMNYDAPVSMYFKETADKDTYKLAFFEIDGKRLQKIDSLVPEKGQVSTGLVYLQISSQLPENATKGSYYIVIESQGMSREYLVNLDKNAFHGMPTWVYIVAVFLGIIIIGLLFAGRR